MNRSYSEMMLYDNFQDRFEYLRLRGYIGVETFGHERYLNQALYQSREWRDFRRRIIIRDNGCDLGIPGHEIFDRILIHHINPLTVDDILNRSPRIFDMDNVVCTSDDTHNAIHYGNEQYLSTVPIERRPGDMCPWK